MLASKERVEREILAEELAGKIVVVADVSTGTSDVGAIPLDANFPLGGLHTNVMHTILSENFLRELSEPEMLLIEALLLGVLLLLALRFASLPFALGTLGLAIGYVALVVLGFLYGHLIANVVRPLLMLTGAVVAIVVQRYATEEKARLEGLRQRDFIRDTFGRYLSPDVVEELLGSPKGLRMGGELREITLLVSDLRGFTSLAERLSPPEVIAILNRYFERMVDVIARYRGTVDELQGDGMLTFFGAPLAVPDDPERAVACALEMQLALPAKPTESLVSLASPLPLACFPVEGKIVSETAMPGALLRLAGVINAEATLAGQVALYTNVKLRLEPSGGPPCTDVYAKVVASESPDAKLSRVRLEFTALPDDAKVLLTKVGQTASGT